MSKICNLCENHGYMLEVTYIGKELDGLENGDVVRGWNKWVSVRYNVLKKYNPSLPEFSKFDPYNTEQLEEYANALRGTVGRELERHIEKAVFCECEIGAKCKQESIISQTVSSV